MEVQIELLLFGSTTLKPLATDSYFYPNHWRHSYFYSNYWRKILNSVTDSNKILLFYRKQLIENVGNLIHVGETYDEFDNSIVSYIFVERFATDYTA